MSVTHTFQAEHVLKAFIMKPNGVLVLKVQKTKKTYQCIYLDMCITVGNLTSNGGWFHVRNITLTGGILDPVAAKTKFTRGDSNLQRLRLTSNVSSSGDFGKFLVLFSNAFIAEINRLGAEKAFAIGKRTINGFVQTHISDESPNVELRGQPIADPVVRMNIDFSEPQLWKRKGYPWGKTVTQFFDYTSAYVDDDGKTQYKPSTLKNSEGVLEPITEHNVHEFITPGSIIREAVVFCNSASVSQGYISSKLVIANCVIERIVADGNLIAEPDFGDAVATTEQKVVTTDEKVNPEAVVCNNDDINNLLNSMAI